MTPAELAAKSRIAQGLAPRITDPVAVARLAALISQKAADVTTPTAREVSGHASTDYRHRGAS
jgi:hypothetical protein